MASFEEALSSLVSYLCWVTNKSYPLYAQGSGAAVQVAGSALSDDYTNNVSSSVDARLNRSC
jgi:hypothetical protein